MTEIRLLTAAQTREQTAIRHSRHYEMIAEGTWTPPVRIGARSYWPAHEVDALLAARIRGISEDEMRAVVRKMIEQRKTVGKTA